MLCICPSDMEMGLLCLDRKILCWFGRVGFGFGFWVWVWVRFRFCLVCLVGLLLIFFLDFKLKFVFLRCSNETFCQ